MYTMPFRQYGRAFCLRAVSSALSKLSSVPGLSLHHSLSRFSEQNTGLGTKTYLSEGRNETIRECRHNISEQAVFCPGCGAPYPGKEKWDGWGFEYKSQATLLGLPLLHVSFKYRPNRRPVPAKGVIAIGSMQGPPEDWV